MWEGSQAHNVEEKERKNKQRELAMQDEGEGCGGEGLVWMQCKVSSFSL